MHSKTIKPLSTLAITTILALQSLTAFAAEDPDKIIIVGTKPKPGLPGCMDLGNCTPGDQSPGLPGTEKPPVEDSDVVKAAKLAATMKTIDVRCQAGMPDTTSQAEPLQRLAAAQGAFDAKGMRMGYLWDTVKKKLGMAGSRLTVTFADGGSEVYAVISVTGSVSIAPVPGSLVRGSGQVESADCNKG